MRYEIRSSVSGFRSLVRHWTFIVSLLLQLVLAVTLAHGYDFRVGIVAGRNIALGNSPYDGGAAPEGLAEGYGPDVQGIGETPMWPLYLGVVYLASSEDHYVFNFLSKLPIIVANVVLAYFAYRKWGRKGSYLFLFNPFLLLISSAWGKPDNIATLLAVVALTVLRVPSLAATLTGMSLMIKPLGLPLIPPMVGYYSRLGSRALLTFLGALLVTSTTIFFAPFLLLGWPLETVFSGLSNWLTPAGGLSLFNLVEFSYGISYLPRGFELLGLLPVIGLAGALIYSLIRAPTNRAEVVRYSLVASVIFLTTRTWVSEQNLVLLFPLFLLASGRLPGKLLWAIPLLFMVVNTSMMQLTYLAFPNIINLISEFDSSWGEFRLLAKFLLNIPWLFYLLKATRSALVRA